METHTAIPRPPTRVPHSQGLQSERSGKAAAPPAPARLWLPQLYAKLCFKARLPEQATRERCTRSPVPGLGACSSQSLAPPHPPLPLNPTDSDSLESQPQEAAAEQARRDASGKPT